ncbi:MAG: glycosyltransferase family 4 protein [Rubrivivax sp.]|jgi:glycosyltransferase involved in cell wall biosynthesis
MTKVCFVGLDNLPVISREHNHHGIGGEQVQHTLLARALARRGFDASMVVADYGQPDGLEIDGVRLHRAHALDEGVPVVRFLHPRLTGLWRALGRADAQVYYVSTASSQLGVVAAFARRHGRRVVFRIAHDLDCDPKRLLIRFWRDRKLYEWGLRRANAVLAQSRQQRAALRANYGLDSRVAAMLVEPARRDLAFGQRDVPVLWVNNLRPFKRPDLALALAQRLPEQRLHMIGGPQDGHEDLFDATRRQAAAIGNLQFHGRVAYHDVNDFYERAQVFVNTSDSEGFPNSYLQAWRRGVPTVSFFDPDGLIARFGLGHAARSLEDMALAVQRLTHNADEWHAASARCRHFMDERYGDDTVLRPYLEALGG